MGGDPEVDWEHGGDPEVDWDHGGDPGVGWEQRFYRVICLGKRCPC